ncbi:MAG: hypothetical protein K2H03_05275, partial [Muribaculaceae bacterium]|nr:hypothetical protein [Muribaculaceae bacterium]
IMYIHPFVDAYIKKGLLFSMYRKWRSQLGRCFKIVPDQSLAYLQYRVVDADGNELDLREDKDTNSSSTDKKNKAKKRLDGSEKIADNADEEGAKTPKPKKPKQKNKSEKPLQPKADKGAEPRQPKENTDKDDKPKEAEPKTEKPRKEPKPRKEDSQPKDDKAGTDSPGESAAADDSAAEAGKKTEKIKAARPPRPKQTPDRAKAMPESKDNGDTDAAPAADSIGTPSAEAVSDAVSEAAADNAETPQPRRPPQRRQPPRPRPPQPDTAGAPADKNEGAAESAVPVKADHLLAVASIQEANPESGTD